MFDDVCSTFFCWKNVLLSIKHFLQHTTNVEASGRAFNNDQSEVRARLQSENHEQSKMAEVEIVEARTPGERSIGRIKEAFPTMLQRVAGA